MENKTIGMMQKMNIKLPPPTQFDGRYPQFHEWAREVRAYLSVHNVSIEEIWTTAQSQSQSSYLVTFRTNTQQMKSVSSVQHFRLLYKKVLTDMTNTWT
eukprot:813085-Amphidinium_carterae.1